MAEGDFRALLRAARLERDDGLFPGAGEGGGAGKGRNVVHAFDVETNRSDAVIPRQRLDHLRHVDIGEIADGEHGSERQGAPCHGEIAGDVAGLADNGDAAVPQADPMLIRPERGAGDAVHVAVAVGTHQRHPVRRGEESVLQVRIAGFGETGGIDNRAAASFRAKRAHDLDRRLPLHGNEGRVDRAVDPIDRSKRRHTAELAALGMHGMDGAWEAELDRAADRDIAFGPADEGDRLWVEQTGEIAGHAASVPIPKFARVRCLVPKRTSESRGTLES